MAANQERGSQNNLLKNYLLLVITLLLNVAAWATPGVRTFTLAPDVEVPVSVYNTHQKDLILWLPSEQGVVTAEHESAAQLAKLGYEVWVADLFAARFLPISPSSLDAIPVSDVSQLIDIAALDHTNLYILSSSRGAGRALEGAQHWLQQNPSHPLAGAILLFPNLHLGTPEAGEAPLYLPVTAHLKMSIAILQGDLSPWFWQLDALKTQLGLGGSTVAIKTLPGVRDRFYFREDALPRERAAAQQLAAAIHECIRRLPAVNPKENP